jgi:hypothetical protein
LQVDVRLQYDGPAGAVPLARFQLVPSAADLYRAVGEVPNRAVGSQKIKPEDNLRDLVTGVAVDSQALAT